MAPGENGIAEGDTYTANVKLTKLVVEGAAISDHEQELRDTIVPGFRCKVTPAARKV